MTADIRKAALPLLGLLSACLAPYVAFYEANWQQLAFRQTLEPLAGLAGLFLILMATSVLLSRVTRRGIAPFALIGATLVSSFFLYSQISASVGRVLVLAGFPQWDGSSGVLLLLVLLACVIVFVASRFFVTTFALSVYFITGLASPAILLAMQTAKEQTGSIALANEQGDFEFERLSGENVYWIVPDGYAGQRTLDEFYGFDNSEFLNRMQDTGFRVMDARSNAIATHVSIASMLYLNYLPEGSGIYSDRNLLYPGMLDIASTPPLLSILLDHGYRLFLSGNTWSGCTGVAMTCIGEISELSYASRTILSTTPVAPLIVRYAPASFDAISPMMAKLPELMDQRPFFALVHHLSPHPPYVLDRNCQPRTESEQETLDKAGYIESIRCVNKMLEEAVQTILQKDPEAVIVIQSDHGGELFPQWTEPMADWSTAFIDERAHNLGLIYAPEACREWLRSDLGQINTARFVLGCLARKAPSYLEEKTMLTTYETSTEFGTVVYHRFPQTGQ